MFPIYSLKNIARQFKSDLSHPKTDSSQFLTVKEYLLNYELNKCT